MDATITIPAIDENGNIYPMEKLAAHRDGGVLHLAISIFVFSQGRLLIQRRAGGKYHSGGLWANTCCTHPNWGESLHSAAHRRLQEELGFDVPLLEERAVVDYHARVSDALWEKERVHVFEYATHRALPAPVPVLSEVSEIRWMSPADICTEMQKTPEAYAPWFRIYFNRWDELNLSASFK